MAEEEGAAAGEPLPLLPLLCSTAAAAVVAAAVVVAAADAAVSLSAPSKASRGAPRSPKYRESLCLQKGASSRACLQAVPVFFCQGRTRKRGRGKKVSFFVFFFIFFSLLKNKRTSTLTDAGS